MDLSHGDSYDIFRRIPAMSGKTKTTKEATEVNYCAHPGQDVEITRWNMQPCCLGFNDYICRIDGHAVRMMWNSLFFANYCGVCPSLSICTHITYI